ncbi:MAG TPA: DUF1801 domain-containing protein [Chitinophagaceae bacterium]|nr:DUF1801 domain-containing protein [Chitinophagaceae bacterium]
MQTNSATDIDSYIADFPKEVQKLLQQLRSTIIKAAPGAKETIKYAIPTFYLNGNLVHFAGYKNHIGFYPTPSAIKKFEKELAQYKGAKGSVQFPLDAPLPLDLVKRIVGFRVFENTEERPVKTKKAASPGESFLSLLSAPARRALEGKGINTEKALAQYTKAQVLKLHGVGPASIPVLQKVLQQKGLSFKKEEKKTKPVNASL